MNSMTGYSYAECVVEGTHVSVELKSVNSRFLDLSVCMPSFLNPLEQRIREALSKKILRGKVDINIRVRDESPVTKVSVDKNAVLSFYEAIRETASAIGKTPDDIPLSLIISQEGVLTVFHEYDAELYWKKISGVFDSVLESFCADREREGKNLKRDLLEKLSCLDQCASFFEKWQPKMETKFRETITKKFNELLADRADENRIMQETAAMLVKYTINEEIIRLKSHLEAMRKEIEENH